MQKNSSATGPSQSMVYAGDLKEMPRSVIALVKKTLPDQKEKYYEIDVPEDGTCLFYSLIFSLLLPALEKAVIFQALFKQLFGQENVGAEENIKQLLQEYDGTGDFIKKHKHGTSFEKLVDIDFRKQLVAYMLSQRETFSTVEYTEREEGEFTAVMARMAKPKTFGCHREIAAVSKWLGKSIKVYQKTSGGELELLPQSYGALSTEIIHLVHVPSLKREGNQNTHYHYCLLTQCFPRVIKNEPLTNPAVSHFSGLTAGQKDLRVFDNWYSTTALENITFASYPATQSVRALRCVFLPESKGSKDGCSFEKQFTMLIMLKNSCQAPVTCFIAFEPTGMDNHFIFGVLVNRQLLIIDPLGNSFQEKNYSFLIKVVKSCNFSVVVSRTVLQRDPNGLVSCGVLSAELMRHIAALSPDAVTKALTDTKAEKSELKLEKDQTMPYLVIDIANTSLLPVSFHDIHAIKSDTEYQNKLVAIRHSHLALLERGTDVIQSEHVLFNQLLMDPKFLDQLSTHPNHKALVKRFSPAGEKTLSSSMAKLPLFAKLAIKNIRSPQHIRLRSKLTEVTRITTNEVLDLIISYGAEKKLALQPNRNAEVHYIQALKEANHERIASSKMESQHFRALLKPLGALADLYVEQAMQADSEGQEKNEILIKAAHLYNTALVIDRNNVKDKNNQLQLRQALVRLEDVFLKSLNKNIHWQFNSPLWQQQGESIYKPALQEIRTQMRLAFNILDQKLEEKPIDSQKDVAKRNMLEYRAKAIQKMAENCQVGLKKYLSDLIKQCENILGQSPCQYAVLTYGSWAKGTATPYSDIEFSILIEDKSELLNEENRNYFRELTTLLHLKILSIGESLIPMSWYGIHLDDLLESGVQFDLGGKTPAGRRYKQGNAYHVVELIRTPTEMLELLTEEYYELDRLLPTELAAAMYLMGDETLYKQYLEKSQAYLSEMIGGRARFQQYAIKNLNGYEDIQSKLDCLKMGDLNRYNIDFNLDDVGKLYEIKKEFYRVTDLLLAGLSFLYGFTPDTLWNTVDKLVAHWLRYSPPALMNEANTNLTILCAIVTEIRYRTYLAARSQKGALSIKPHQKSAIVDLDLAAVFYLPDPAILYELYYRLSPLYNTVETICRALTEKKIDEIICWCPFYENNAKISARIASRLLQFENASYYYNKAILAIREALKNVTADDEKIAGHSIKQLGYLKLLEEYGHFLLTRVDKQAPIYLQERLDLSRTLFGEDSFQVIMAYTHLGVAYATLESSSTEALRCFQKALEIYNKIAGNAEDSDLKRAILNNMGYLFITLGDLEKGTSLLKKAFKKNTPSALKLNGFEQKHIPSLHAALFTSDDSTSEGKYLNNLGEAYRKSGKPEEAIKYYQRAYEIDSRVYEADHPWMSSLFNNIGLALYDLGYNRKAIICLENSLRIDKKNFGEKNQRVAEAFDKLGMVWAALGVAKRAIECNQKAITIIEELYGKQHPLWEKFARSLIGSCYASGSEAFLFSYKHFFRDSGVVLEQLCSLNQAGMLYVNSLRYSDAIVCFEKAVDITQKNYGKDHLLNAWFLNNLAGARAFIRDKRAIQCYQQVLVLEEKYIGNFRFTIASTLANLGAACLVCDEADESLNYLKRALEVHAKSYRGLSNAGINIADRVEQENNTTAFQDEKILEDNIRSFEVSEKEQMVDEYAVPSSLVVHVLNNLSSAYIENKDYKNALHYSELALSIGKKIHGKWCSVVGCIFNQMGEVTRRLGKPREAIAFLKQAVLVSRFVHGEIHPHLANHFTNLGLAWQALGKIEKSIFSLIKAYAMYVAILGIDNIQTKQIYLTLRGIIDRSLELLSKYSDPQKIPYYVQFMNSRPYNEIEGLFANTTLGATIRYYDLLTALVPWNVNAYYYRAYYQYLNANILKQQNKSLSLINKLSQSAIGSFQFVIQKQPSCLFYTGFGLILYREGKQDQAIAQLREALNFAVNQNTHLNFYFREMDTCLLDKNLCQEIKFFDCIVVQDNIMSAYLLLSIYLARPKSNIAEFDHYLYYLEFAVNESPSPIHYSLLAYSYLKFNKAKLAAEAFRTAIRHYTLDFDPTKPEYTLAINNLNALTTDLSAHSTQADNKDEKNSQISLAALIGNSSVIFSSTATAAAPANIHALNTTSVQGNDEEELQKALKLSLSEQALNSAVIATAAVNPVPYTPDDDEEELKKAIRLSLG